MTKTPQLHANAQIAKHLAWVLSDTYILMIKTHAYHWNVTGSLFPQLHSFFDGLYNELFEASDEIAERIRALNVAAPVSTANFMSMTEVKESTSVPSPKAMLEDLLLCHENLRKRVSEACNFAGETGDKGSEDLLVGRLRAHDKAIWMIKSQLD